MLVRATQLGDLEAFEVLFRRHYSSVRRASARRLCDPAEVEEIVQATFVRAFERIHLCRGDRRFGAWVHVIARNLCTDSLRARGRLVRYSNPDPEGSEGAGEPEERPAPFAQQTAAGDPEELMLVAERARHLRLALARLSDRQRGAIIARAVEDWGPGEIARVMGLSTRAVDSLLLRARRRLAHAYLDVAGEGAPTAR